MVAFVLFGVPFLLGALFAAALAKGLWRTYAIVGLGLLYAFGVVLWAYLSAAPDYQHSNDTEGRQYLGRWWDPDYDLTLAAFGYICWLVGMGIGALLRAIITPALKRAKT